jgi:hypothetical protein
LLAAGTISAGAVVLFTDDFESRSVGSIQGQDSWGVFAGSTNDANIVSDGSRAFQGTKFLAMGNLGTGPRVLQSSFNGLAVHSASNYILSMAVRLEAYNHNGLQTILNGNQGPAFAVHTFLNSQGHMFSATNYSFFTDLGGTPMNTGEWYNVSYVVRPAGQTYSFTVVRALGNTTNLNVELPFAALPGGNPITNWSNIDFRMDAGPNNDFLVDTISFLEVPEPSVAALLAFSSAALVLVRRREG